MNKPAIRLDIMKIDAGIFCDCQIVNHITIPQAAPNNIEVIRALIVN